MRTGAIMTVLESNPGWSRKGDTMLRFRVEDFPSRHSDINGELLIESTRVALETHHCSPARFDLVHGRSGRYPCLVHFLAPDPRSGVTAEAERFAEDGAIVMAGLMTDHFEDLRITRRVPRGNRVDYFLGVSRFEELGVIEVSGTYHRSISQILADKKRQALESPYASPTFQMQMRIFVGVTRFAPAACTCLEELT